jgi:alpha-tubulin suppressor-like RCC1 family protein
MRDFDHIFMKEETFYKCNDVVFPMYAECFNKMKVLQIACGESHTIALIEDISSNNINLWSWGMNNCGQLGLGERIKQSNPNPINYFLSYKDFYVESIQCGAFHSMCIISNKIFKNKEKNKENENDFFFNFLEIS